MPTRRSLLLAAAAAAPAFQACSSTPTLADTAARDLAGIESSAGGRLGVVAIDTGTGHTLAHRADERFALCSTFKAIAAGAVLARSVTQPGLLEQRIGYGKEELVTYSPVTEKHVGAGMTVAALCAAGLQYSDNTAGNLMLKLLGGPAGLTAYARSIGDTAFRLDRWETELNTAIPGDPRDTSTPAAMARSLQRLLLGDALGAAQRTQLVEWMKGNTTGNARIRAGVPAGWTVADKTGSGDYGTTNDVGVAWPPGRAPLVLALYYAQADAAAKYRNDVMVSATEAVVRAFA